jgi:hypothetical protein
LILFFRPDVAAVGQRLYNLLDYVLFVGRNFILSENRNARDVDILLKSQKYPGFYAALVCKNWRPMTVCVLSFGMMMPASYC